jgi:hypothetical protein
MNASKPSTITGSVVLLFLGSGFYIGILLLFLDPTNKILVPIGEIALIGCFCGLWMHGAIYALTRSLKMDAKKFAPIPADGIVSSTSVKIGTLESYFNIFAGVLWVFLIVVAIAPFAFTLIQRSTFTITPAATMFVVGVLIYGILLRPIINWLARSARKMGRSSLASFTIDGNSIIIDLNMRQLSDPAKKFIVRISFDELDEIRSLNYFEARTFMDYEIGPSISLTVAAVRDLTKYLKGEISRPNYYAINTDNSSGNTLFLHGPNFLYLLAVQNANCDELIQAFTAYKASKNTT